MRCKNCGWDNPGGNVKCEKCNAPLTGSMGGHGGGEKSGDASDGGTNVNMTAKGCPSCGYPIRAGIVECPQCGYLFTGKKKVDNPGGDPPGERATDRRNDAKDGNRRDTVPYSDPGDKDSSPAGRKIVGLLVTYSHNADGEVFVIREGHNYVGRNKSEDISIPGDAKISGRHLLILYRVADSKFKFWDMDSRNKTFVNGVMTLEGELNHADVITVGVTKLVFVKIPD